MRTRAWQCVAGAALVIGTLSAAQSTGPEPEPRMVERSHSTVQPTGPRDPDRTIYLLAGSGLVAIGGVVLVGGVVGLGGLRIPGGVAMAVGRTRYWARSMRTRGAHRAR
jgi:hypothetical protein